MRRNFVGLTNFDVIQLTPSKSVPQNFIKERAMTNLLVALSSMYEKSLANKKLHQMKRIFNLNMSKGAYVAQHLNDFNRITNQLSFVEIEFDNEIRALILLVPLPNS